MLGGPPRNEGSLYGLLERGDFIPRVVVKAAHVVVVGATHEPLLPRNELCASDRRIGFHHFELLDQGLAVVVPNENVARVQRREDPGSGVSQHT